METQHIHTGKIVSSPTDTTWAQAYSAGKLYTVLSLEGTHDTSLAGLGKETIEKLQREFFALDEKSLASIKKSVETVVLDIPSGISYSLVLATLVDSALYLIIAGIGYVVLKRKDSTTCIAAGEHNTVTTFSGKFEPYDIFLLETESFLKTLSMEKVTQALNEKTSHEISENLALVMHEKSNGLEAGLVIQLGEIEQKTIKETPEETENMSVDPSNDHLELDETPQNRRGFRLPTLRILNISSKIPRNLSKKQLIAIAVIILLLILGGGIFIENNKRQDTKLNTQVESLINQHTGAYEEALAVMELNKSLAVEELMNIKTAVEAEQKNYPKGSAARKKLDEFLTKINDALGGNVPNSNSPISVFFDGEKNSDLHSVLFVTQKGGNLSVAGNSKVGVLSSNGSVDETYDSSSTTGLSSNEDSIFVLSTKGVSKIDKSSGKSEEIFSTTGKSIDTFGDNLYVLEGKTISKYRPNAYKAEEYFTKDATLKNPSSIAIDSSIYIVDDSKIRKFTRGKEDTFSYSGPSLSTKSLAYTDEDYVNLYVVDPSSKMAYVIDKSGNKVSEFSLKGMRNITGITANEKDKKIFIAGDNKIYSISF